MESVIIVGSINLLLGYVLWFFFFRTYFIDSYRHELFRLRNELFDYAFKNEISFDHLAFRDRWDEINGMIRHAHVTYPMLISTLFSLNKEKDKYKLYRKHREQNLSSLDNQYVTYFNNNRNEEFNLFFSYIVKSSIIFLLFSFIFALIFFAIAYIYNFNKRKKLRNKIKSQAEPLFDNYTFRSLRMA